MDIEEFDPAEPQVGDGDGPSAGRVPVLVWVAVALVALVAGFLVLGRGGTPEPAAAPTPGLTSSSRAATAPVVAGPNQRQYLGVTGICAPVTDGRRKLAATFEVTNVSGYRVGIDSVVGVLPRGGLRQDGPATRGGGCDKASRLMPAGPLDAGQSQYYTLHFTLPKTCPARFSVQVRLGFAARGFDETSLSLLYSDLSVPDFSTCGPGSAPARSKASASR